MKRDPKTCDVCQTKRATRGTKRGGLAWCTACRKLHATAERTIAPFAAIVSEAERIGLPTAYHRDLWLHDRDALTANPLRPFVWAIGQTGTTIVWCDLATVRNHGARGFFDARSMVRTLVQCSRETLYHWNGRTLTRVNETQAEDILAGRTDADAVQP